MKITFEMTLDEKDMPLYCLRSASLMSAMAQALRDEAYGRGSVISNKGQGVTIGTESLICTNITTGE